MNIDTVFIPNKETINYEYKITSLYNREYYDFSAILDNKIWGFFAEGGHLECSEKNKNNCTKFKGYNGAGYKAGTVFNADNCEIIVGPQFTADSRIVVNLKKEYQYSESPSFYGFINIGEDIYRFSFNINATFGDLLNVLKPEGASLILNSIKNKNQCAFFTDDLRKLEK